jgi:hypothetical protein
MEINDAASILVIIISVLLGLMLLVSIIAGVMVVRLLKTVKRVVAKAEEVMDSAEAVADAFKNVKGPLGALKLVKNLAELAKDFKKGKK